MLIDHSIHLEQHENHHQSHHFANDTNSKYQEQLHFYKTLKFPDSITSFKQHLNHFKTFSSERKLNLNIKLFKLKRNNFKNQKNDNLTSYNSTSQSSSNHGISNTTSIFSLSYKDNTMSGDSSSGNQIKYLVFKNREKHKAHPPPSNFYPTTPTATTTANTSTFPTAISTLSSTANTSNSKNILQFIANDTSFELLLKRTVGVLILVQSYSLEGWEIEFPNFLLRAFQIKVGYELRGILVQTLYAFSDDEHDQISNSIQEILSYCLQKPNTTSSKDDFQIFPDHAMSIENTEKDLDTNLITFIREYLK